MNRLKPHLWLFAANFIYGVNYSVAKAAMELPIPPSAFVFLRVSGAAIIFFIIALLYRSETFARRDLPRLIACAFFGVTLNQVLFFEGLHRTSPINAGIIMVITPVLVLVFTWLFLREKAGFLKIVGVLSGLTGALLLIINKEETNLVASLEGDIMILINAASYAVYLVMVKPLMTRYEPLSVMKAVFLIGIPMVLIPAYPQFNEMHLGQIGTTGWMAVLYVILFTTVIAYLLNILAMKKVSPSVVGIYIYLQPLLAAFFAILLGQDRIRLIHLISSLLIFAGVYLVSRPIKKLS